MTIQSTLEALGQLPLSVYVAENPVAFPWIELFHVFAITIVFGSILFVDLRLVGLAARDYPISGVSRAVVPITWVAFVIAAITGSLLFMSNPTGYYNNTYFRAKILLMLCAGINMAIFHVWTWKSVRQWDEAAAIPATVKFAGLISILIWVTVVICGRWIGFTIAPF